MEQKRVAVRREQTLPAGGYVLVPVPALCAVWALYQTKRIRLFDLRVWFACREMAARRCALACGRKPRFTTGELHALVGGVGGEHLRASLRRLQVSGVLKWSATGIAFGGPADNLPAEFRTHVSNALAIVPNNRRRIPVPRRVLRLIAGGCRRAVVATVLGHLFRCVYSRAGALTATGRCKASWVAAVFGLDVRTVKAARKHLVGLGWLVPAESRQWEKNRWGSCVTVNLGWTHPDRVPARSIELSTSGSPPPCGDFPTGSPPPVPNKELLAESTNQKPAGRGPTGASRVKVRGGGPPAPTLRHVVPEDLRDTARLLALFRLAVRSGRVAGSAHERLQFVAAAEHALAIGRRNPCGLFAHLIRGRLWHFATQADEDTARRRLTHTREPAGPPHNPADVPGSRQDLTGSSGMIAECVDRIVQGWSLRMPRQGAC